MSWWLILLLVKRYYPLLQLFPLMSIFGYFHFTDSHENIRLENQHSCDLILFTADGCIPTYATGWEDCICGVFFWKSRTHQNHKNLRSFWSQPIPISRGAKPPLANEVRGILIWNPKNKDLEKGAACFSNCDWVFVFFLLSFPMGLETFHCKHSVSPVEQHPAFGDDGFSVSGFIWVSRWWLMGAVKCPSKEPEVVSYDQCNQTTVLLRLLLFGSWGVCWAAEGVIWGGKFCRWTRGCRSFNPHWMLEYTTETMFWTTLVIALRNGLSWYVLHHDFSAFVRLTDRCQGACSSFGKLYWFHGKSHSVTSIPCLHCWSSFCPPLIFIFFSRWRRRRQCITHLTCWVLTWPASAW